MNKLFTKIHNFTLTYFTRNYLDRTEAAYYTGISETFLIKLSESKVIKSVSNENKLFRKSELDWWIKEYGVVNPMFIKR